MSRTPLINVIRQQGGKTITMPSASEDLSFTFNDDGKKFRFSKFVCLNIPDIKRPVNDENYIQFDAIQGAYPSIVGNVNNTYLAESFQNYLLNFETMLTSRDDYDPSLDRTVSERAFFKWLKELGAIRYRQALSNEVSNSTVGARYVEENESESYNRVVQYIGSIDMINSIKNNTNSYTEVYIHIPTTHGNTPTLLFKIEDDINYTSDLVIQNTPLDPRNNEYLFGRNFDSVHPNGLSTLAYFDSDTDNFVTTDYSLFKFNENTQNYEPGWWFNNPTDNAYLTENGALGNQQNDRLRIIGQNTQIGHDVDILRSRLDGVTVDFNPSSYFDIVNNSNIDTIGDYNASNQSQSFDFNAVLVYYDIYDTKNPENFTTNLYAVHFLDDVQNDLTNGGFIERFPKFKPNPLTGDNGVAYGIKLNLKFDTNADDAAIETIVNDYNTFSLDIFLEALNSLRESAVIVNNSQKQLGINTNKITELESQFLDNVNNSDLQDRVTSLENALQANQSLFENTQNVIDLINQNQTNIQNIYDNTTSVDIAYNLDVIKSGNGINIDRTINNTLFIQNTVENINFNEKPVINFDDDFDFQPTRWLFNHQLINFTNYIKIDNNSLFEPDRDVYIEIDDSINTWKRGQKFKLNIGSQINMSNAEGNYNLHIVTDAIDRLGTRSFYNKTIAIVTFNQFQQHDNMPNIEIYCYDDINLQFIVDFI